MNFFKDFVRVATICAGVFSTGIASADATFDTMLFFDSYHKSTCTYISPDSACPDSPTFKRIKPPRPEYYKDLRIRGHEDVTMITTGSGDIWIWDSTFSAARGHPYYGSDLFTIPSANPGIVIIYYFHETNGCRTEPLSEDTSFLYSRNQKIAAEYRVRVVSISIPVAMHSDHCRNWNEVWESDYLYTPLVMQFLLANEIYDVGSAEEVVKFPSAKRKEIFGDGNLVVTYAESGSKKPIILYHTKVDMDRVRQAQIDGYNKFHWKTKRWGKAGAEILEAMGKVFVSVFD